MSHTNPRAPVIRNAGRQLPKYRYSRGTITVASAAPTDEPLSNRATAHPRSRRGNHSLTALVAAGQFAASPAPSRKRRPTKLAKPDAPAVSIAIVEYQSTARDKPLRVPKR